ncbi:MAG TPA: TonB-dependent receptor plug domain-containing protein [Chitinispirillaceae bacterium]|nr:TonB-dependent receptor plug domain-containing protein [Chitinispirillaceae bacterium]
MKSTINELENMVVVGNFIVQKKPSQTTSVTRLSNFELTNTAGTVNDINRVLSTHPAVVNFMGSNFDNSLFVRGGHSHENVYLIDGIEMENAKFYYSFSGAVFDIKNKYTDKKWYNDANNIRATAGLSLGWNSRHHGISLRVVGAGGKPFNAVIYDIQSSSYILDSSKKYCSEFLDPFFTLNLRYSFKLYPRWGTVTGYMEIWNLLNYTPVVERYYPKFRS